VSDCELTASGCIINTVKVSVSIHNTGVDTSQTLLVTNPLTDTVYGLVTWVNQIKYHAKAIPGNELMWPIVLNNIHGCVVRAQDPGSQD
jgi:hypothetical protein